MKKIILILGMLSIEIFFIISTIIGFEYTGSKNSSAYIIYCIIIAALNIILIPCYFIIEKKRMDAIKILFLILPIIPIICFGISVAGNGISEIKTNFFEYFILWSVPAIYSAVYINAKNMFKSMVKWFEIVMILGTIAIGISILNSFFKGVRYTSLGGATYQCASYISAFTYGINLYFIFYGKDQERFKFTKTVLYSIINKILLIIQLFGVMVTGGRGGAVLVLIYTIYISVNVFKERKVSNLSKYILYMIVLFMFAFILQGLFSDNNLFKNSIQRITSYISKDGIDWDGTSGRDVIFKEAIELIKSSPILGYGLYGFLDLFPMYPHNIFLELMLNGGLIYTLLSIIIFVITISKYRKISKLDKRNRFIMILLLYPLTDLMFSGSYMRSGPFWFVMILILTSNYNDSMEKKINEKCDDYIKL